MTALCHCKGCQNWGGRAFSSNLGVPTTNFSITKGDPKDWVRSGDVSGKENRHLFCGGMSRLVTTMNARQGTNHYRLRVESFSAAGGFGRHHADQEWLSR